MNLFKSRFLTYVALPVGLIWGGLYSRYNAPDGFNDPKEGKSVAHVREMGEKGFQWELEDFAKEHVNAVTFLNVDSSETLNVRNALKFIDDYDPEHKEKEKVIYCSHIYKSQYSTDFLQYYKISMDLEDLKELQHFTDSVCKSRNPKAVANLYIKPEMDYAGLIEYYNQAYHYNPIQEKTGKLSDTSRIYLTASTLKNHTMDETKNAIAHELGHKFFRNQKDALISSHSAKDKNNSLLAEFKEEVDADSIALEITKNPDAMISAYGKDNKALNKIETLLGWFFKDIDKKFNPTDHPTDLARAQYAQKWKDQHQKNNQPQ